jgi:hypothetical protein
VPSAGDRILPNFGPEYLVLSVTRTVSVSGTDTVIQDPEAPLVVIVKKV